MPVYVWAPEEEGGWPPGAASRWWLHHSLAALERALQRQGSRLVIRRGPAASAAGLMAETGADAVFWNRRYEPAAVAREAELKRSLRGCARASTASLLHEPWTVATGSGSRTGVHAVLARAAEHGPHHRRRCCRRAGAPVLQAAIAASARPGAAARCRLGRRAGRILEARRAGARPRRSTRSAGAVAPLRRRPRPAGRRRSRLSPHLHFGELVAAPGLARGARPSRRRRAAICGSWAGASSPTTCSTTSRTRAEQPLRPAFRPHALARRPDGAAAWQRGGTGYPLVDAGMRQLWETGWMHNRVRMVAASFLTKHLLIDWQRGRALVLGHAGRRRSGEQHAGLAVGGRQRRRCRAVPPHLQPERQAQRYDADGAYVERWLDGRSSRPIVDHAAARRAPWPPTTRCGPA